MTTRTESRVQTLENVRDYVRYGSLEAARKARQSF